MGHPAFDIADGGWAFVDGEWWVRPPGTPGAAKLHPEHRVVDHGDGSITVSPSILLTGGNYSWHGYLVAGRWRAA